MVLKSKWRTYEQTDISKLYGTRKLEWFTQSAFYKLYVKEKRRLKRCSLVLSSLNYQTNMWRKILDREINSFTDPNSMYFSTVENSMLNTRLKKFLLKHGALQQMTLESFCFFDNYLVDNRLCYTVIGIGEGCSVYVQNLECSLLKKAASAPDLVFSERIERCYTTWAFLNIHELRALYYVEVWLIIKQNCPI